MMQQVLKRDKQSGVIYVGKKEELKDSSSSSSEAE